MLLAIQVVHTLIAVINFAALFYMAYAHWTGRGREGLLRLCYLAIVIEAIAIIPFGLSCPITLYVEANWSRGTPAMLVPREYSKGFIEFGGALLAFALMPVIYRHFRPRPE